MAIFEKMCKALIHPLKDKNRFQRPSIKNLTNQYPWDTHCQCLIMGNQSSDTRNMLADIVSIAGIGFPHYCVNSWNKSLATITVHCKKYHAGKLSAMVAWI
jgi:hypothetical protein